MFVGVLDVYLSWGMCLQKEVRINVDVCAYVDKQVCVCVRPRAYLSFLELHSLYSLWFVRTALCWFQLYCIWSIPPNWSVNSTISQLSARCTPLRGNVWCLEGTCSSKCSFSKVKVGDGFKSPEGPVIKIFHVVLHFLSVLYFAWKEWRNFFEF